MYRNLTCPSCESKILSSDINLNRAIAKCSSCHVVFNIEPQFREKNPPNPQAPRYKDPFEKEHPRLEFDTQNDILKPNFPVARKEEIFIIPKGIEVLKMLSELNIDVKWRGNVHWFLVIFTLIWNAFIFVFLTIALSSGTYGILLFMSAHILVGVGLIYRTLAGLFNTTHIVVDHSYTTIQHRPFKVFFKEIKIETRNIEQLYVKKYIMSRTNGKPNYAYGVMAKMKDGSEIRIVKGIKRTEQALFIEQEIEKFTGIVDRPVRGEI